MDYKRSPKSPKSLKTSPKRAVSPKKSSLEQEWESSKFVRELSEKLESMTVQPHKLRSPKSPRKLEPTDQYEEDILEFLKRKEKLVKISDKFPKQTDITENMRSITVDWLLEVAEEYHLANETFHLGVTILDKYIDLDHEIPRSKLQLYAVAAFLIASKYEEVASISINDLTYISDNTFTAAQIRNAEVEMLVALKYEITDPTCANFASIYFDILKPTIEQRTMAKYIMDSSRIHMSGYKYLPSLIAAGAIFYAIRAAPGKTKRAWTPKMETVTGYSEKKVRKVALLAVNSWLKPDKLEAVNKKYARVVNHNVSKLPIVSESVLKESFSPGPASPRKSPKKVSPKKISPKKSPKKSPLKKYSPSTVIKVRSEPRDVGMIQYSEAYRADDGFEYRHVILPPAIARLVPYDRLLSEEEWRSLGVQQSRGWVNYAKHRPEPNLLLFKRPIRII